LGEQGERENTQPDDEKENRTYHTLPSSAKKFILEDFNLIFFSFKASILYMRFLRVLSGVVCFGIIVILGADSLQIEEETLLFRKAESPPLPRLEVESFPSGARVKIDGTPAGITPLLVKDLFPGTHRIQIEKEGYRSEEYTLTVKLGTKVRVKIELEALFGYLSLQNLPPDCEVYLDGKQTEEPIVVLPIGNHTIWIRRFGYEDIRTSISIKENETTYLPLEWKKAPFSVSDFTVTKRYFNPEDPPPSGNTRIIFTLTAPARITLTIFDSQSQPVYTYVFPEPVSWKQEVQWDGRGNQGIPLPDGVYNLVFHFSIPSENIEKVEKITVTLDRSLRMRFRTTYSGLSGTLFSPRVPTLPKGSLNISSFILGLVHSGSKQADLSDSLAHVGFSYSVSNRFEIVPTLSVFIEAAETPPDFLAGIGLSYRWIELFNGTLSLGLSGKGTYANDPRPNGFASIPGFTGGFSLEGRHRYGGILFSPEYTFSPYDLDTLERSFNMYGSVRTGIFLERGGLFAAVSSTFSVDSKRGEVLPLYHTGFEIHWASPSWPFVLSVTIVWIHPLEGNTALYLGGGLGALY
jgi:hypothetical protein